MKCIQIKNEVKTINTMRHQTIYKWKGAAAAGLGPRGTRGDPPAAAVPFHLYMVWCLIVLIVFTSFFICIHFILYFQCVFYIFSHNIYVEGLLFSCPWVWRVSLLETSFWDPPVPPDPRCYCYCCFVPWPAVIVIIPSIPKSNIQHWDQVSIFGKKSP